MATRTDSRGFTPLAIGVALSLGFAACGGSGGGGGPKSLNAVSKCLDSGPFVARPTPGVAHQLSVDNTGAPGQTVYTVTVNPSDKEAQKQVGDQKDEFGPSGANLGGSAVAKGRVVIAYARPVPAAALQKVEKCAF